MFLVEVPVIGPLKVNAYIVKGDGEHLVVDAGPDLLLSRVTLLKSLRKLMVNLGKSVFFATHLHADHFGLIEKFARNSKVYVGSREADLLFSEKNVREVIEFAVENGFPRRDAVIMVRLMLKGYSKEYYELVPLRDGDVIEVGDYKFKCIETPGHTWGHMCLYDQERKILISGDHVLSDITPNISSWSYEEDTLSSYLFSLKKIYGIDARLVLPGHGRPFMNLKKKVVEVILHYKHRLFEIVSILKHRSGDAYWLSSKIKWETRHPVWARALDLMRRWLAFGETLACLNLLARLGIVERRVMRGKVLHYITNIDAVNILNDFLSRVFFNPTIK